MPVPASIDDLSPTPGSNSPAGSESPGLIDDYLRTISAFVAQLRDADAVLRTADRAISSHGVRMSVLAASATGTLTADEIVCKGTGVSWILSAFSKTINLSTTGAGGMDTGAAPASGYVALYAIYNPTTVTSALLAKNATSAVQTETYTGANMPSGYTASALLTVVPTNGSGQFAIGTHVQDDSVWIPENVFYTSSTPQAALFIRDISAVAPPNAKSGDFSTAIGSSNATVTVTTGLAGTAAIVSGVGIGEKRAAATSANVGGAAFPMHFANIPIITPQTIYYRCTVASGTLSFSIACNRYSIR
jgi:hypothetical protein